MLGLIVILIAGGLGAIARYLVSTALPTPERPTRVPRAVLVVNTIGSLIAGVTLALGLTHTIPDGIAIVIITGLCGGLTTFSTFGVETIELFLQGAVAVAWRTIGANVAFSLVAAAVGLVPLYLVLS